jgi:hypothetical protein
MATNIAGHSLGRAAGALLATPLYTWGQTSAMLPGFLLSAGVSVLFNLLALLAVYSLRKRIG